MEKSGQQLEMSRENYRTLIDAKLQKSIRQVWEQHPMCRVSHCLGESMVGATAHRLQGDVEYSSDAEESIFESHFKTNDTMQDESLQIQQDRMLCLGFHDHIPIFASIFPACASAPLQNGTACFPSFTLSPIPESSCIDKTLECLSQGTQSCFLGGVEMQHEWMDTVLKPKRGRNAENETYKTIEETFPTFGKIVTKKQRTVRSSSHQKSNGPDSKDNNKMVSILNSFQSSNGMELSMSQIMKCATLTDTKNNRILMKALVADGRLLVEGRSRATRYRLANHDGASAPIGGNG